MRTTLCFSLHQHQGWIMPVWERKRILIWGKTRPELSRSHKETVCTGGIFEDSKRFVRLYPIPLRFLDDEQVFKKYQWIEADVRKAMRDARPESYNIRCDTIETGETVPTEKGDWSKRAAWVMNPAHIFTSVEALQEARKRDGTSIGIVKPHEVVDLAAEAYPEDEKSQFWTKYRAIQEVQELAFEPEADRHIKPLSPPDFRFKIKFRCDDPACTKVHDIGVYDWEVDALYFRCKQGGDSPERARDKVIAKLRDEVCGPSKDTRFFFGNIASHPHVFIIVGLWYPKRQKVVQATLF